jgi:predicted MFS family arabinose efflux permease
VSGVPLAPEPPYRVLLRHSMVRRQALSGLLAQVTQGASGVGIILVVRQHTGSLALAGGVVGALSIAAGVARPLQGRLIDRRGAAGVMAATGAGHGAALAAIVSLAALRAPGITLVALGAAAGAFLPPVSSAMRVGWGGLVGADERTAAYSLVYLVQELAILTGPLILAAVIAAASASAAVLVVALITAVGALWFASTARRAPAASGTTTMAAVGPVLRSSAVRILLAIAVLVGGVIGAVEVAVPTLATAHRNPAASGLLIAALSVGGIAGAAVYAARRWRSRPAPRLVALLGWLTVAVAAAVAAGETLLAVGALLLLAGLAINPALTTISLLVDRHTPGPTAAEAFGWLSTGIAGGTGAATAIAGAVTQHGASARPAFVVAAVAAAAAMAVAAAGRRALREPRHRTAFSNS